MKPHPLLGRRLLLITAHPDDEAFSAGGTAWENYQHGGQTAIICASLGEKGMSHFKRPTSPAQLKKRRYRELKAAARIAHINPVYILRLPDGSIQRHAAEHRRRSWDIVRRWRPDVILTFGPDGITGHQDHIASGRVGRQLAKQLGCALYTFTLPNRLAKMAPSWFLPRRVNPHYQAIPPYHTSTIRVAIDERRKRKMISRYRSQLDASGPLGNLPVYARKILLRNEYFAKQA